MIKLILSVVATGVAGAIFFMYTQPTYDKAKVVKEEISKYNQALDRAAELQELKQTLLSRYNAFNPESLSRLQKLLPDHVDNVRLVLDLDSLASHHGMGLQNVVISNPGSQTGESSVLGAIGEARQKFDSLTLKFTTRATYDAFISFMADLESSLRVVDLVSLTLSPESSTDASATAMYRFDATVRTYWFK